MALFALIVIVGSMQAGIGWGAEGPKAGLLPVLCRHLIILIASVVNLVQALATSTRRSVFADWGQLRQVLCGRDPDRRSMWRSIPWIGIYVSSVAADRASSCDGSATTAGR